MATTTYFGWETPDDTDLVKDGAAAMRTLGSEIDTSMTDLLGGTTGQVLAKASDDDMDFVWSADAAGMTNPMTTTGDVIYSSSGSTPARLGIGTVGQILTVNSGATAPEWATPAGGGKVLQIVAASYAVETSSSSNSYADTGLTATITPTSATSKILVLMTQNGVLKDTNNTDLRMKMFRGGTEISFFTGADTNTSTRNNIGTVGISYLDSPATTSATTYKTQFISSSNNAVVKVQTGSSTSSIANPQ
jgi:hypothetical protein